MPRSMLAELWRAQLPAELWRAQLPAELWRAQLQLILARELHREFGRCV